MTAKRPRTIDADARVFALEISALVGVSVQRLAALAQAGEIPQPDDTGRFELGATLRAYVSHVEHMTRADEQRKAAAAVRAAAARVRSSFLDGL